jgi:hypothetical protein
MSEEQTFRGAGAEGMTVLPPCHGRNEPGCNAPPRNILKTP